MKMQFVFSRRFLPLFVTQFFGAVNDNFLKNALLIMLTYQCGNDEAAAGGLSNLAAGLFILPYFLFSAAAGQLADKFDKSLYSRVVKLVEIVLMFAAGIGFYFRIPSLLMGILFFMGAQSTFFSPAKYALLPEHLRENELLAGNAWIGGGTYLAILTGFALGGALMTLPDGNLWCGFLLIAFAVIGYWASRKIPSAPSRDPGLKIDWNFFRRTWRILRDDVYGQPGIRSCVLILSVFWLAGSLYVTQTPLFTRHHLGGDELVSTFFFILFSVGVGLGAALSQILLKGRTEIGLPVLCGMVLMGVFSMDLAWIAWAAPAVPEIVPTGELTGTFVFWRTSADVLLIAVCGGLWSVPYQAVIQKISRREVLARVIAGNNIVNSLAMAGGAAAVALLMGFGCADAGTIFAGTGVLLFLTAFYAFRRRR